MNRYEKTFVYGMLFGIMIGGVISAALQSYI